MPLTFRKSVDAYTLILIVALVAPALFVSSSHADQGTRFLTVSRPVGDHYIVILKQDSINADTHVAANDLAQRYGGRIRHVYQHALKGFSIHMPRAAAILLSGNSRVALVEEDAHVSLADQTPWGLDRIDQSDLPLNNTYDTAFTGAGVTVYVIDTGILPKHPEFSGRARIGYDARGEDGLDCVGHGTQVAGIVGGNTFGVAKGVSIVGVRIYDCFKDSTTADVIAGINWVTEHSVKPAIANMSLTIPGGHVGVDTAVRNSIASGVIYTVAAGNSDDDASLFSPARVKEALTVGSIDRTDKRAPTSNYGSVVDIFAPGVRIPTATIDDTDPEPPSGTSMAAPHVAGIAALYFEAYPTMTPAEVQRQILLAAIRDRVIDAGPGSRNRLPAVPGLVQHLNGKIAFASVVDGNEEVLTIGPEGLTNLSNNAASDYQPRWSADGSKIVFVSDRSGVAEIFVMDANGLNQAPLTHTTGASNASPSWSSDGKRIAFIRSTGVRSGDVWVMNADGKDAHQITHHVPGQFPYDFTTTWSPDGRRIAVSRSFSDTIQEIAVVNVDGSPSSDCTRNGVISRNPSWSPDGATIAFDRGPAGRADIYVMSADDCADQRPLTADGGQINQAPTWAPDGSRIGFVSHRTGNYEFWEMSATGKDQKPITFNGVSGNPNWEPRPLARVSALELSALGEPAGSSGQLLVWVGLKNSDDVGLRVDLKADVLVTVGGIETAFGGGRLNDVPSGSSGFSGARLTSIPLYLAGDVPPGAELRMNVSVRRACSGTGHLSGTPRLWYAGRSVDTGPSRDAGSRFDAVVNAPSQAGIEPTRRTYHLRGGSALSTVAGAARLSLDKFVDSRIPCPDRPFVEFGNWNVTLPQG